MRHETDPKIGNGCGDIMHPYLYTALEMLNCKPSKPGSEPKGDPEPYTMLHEFIPDVKPRVVDLIGDSVWSMNPKGHNDQLNARWFERTHLWEGKVEKLRPWVRCSAKTEELRDTILGMLEKHYDGSPEKYDGLLILGMCYNSVKKGAKWLDPNSAKALACEDIADLLARFPRGTVCILFPGTTELWNETKDFTTTANMMAQIVAKSGQCYIPGQSIIRSISRVANDRHFFDSPGNWDTMVQHIVDVALFMQFSSELIEVATRVGTYGPNPEHLPGIGIWMPLPTRWACDPRGPKPVSGCQIDFSIQNPNPDESPWSAARRERDQDQAVARVSLHAAERRSERLQLALTDDTTYKVAVDSRDAEKLSLMLPDLAGKACLPKTPEIGDVFKTRPKSKSTGEIVAPCVETYWDNPVSRTFGRKLPGNTILNPAKAIQIVQDGNFLCISILVDSGTPGERTNREALAKFADDRAKNKDYKSQLTRTEAWITITKGRTQLARLESAPSWENPKGSAKVEDDDASSSEDCPQDERESAKKEEGADLESSDEV